MLRHADNFSIYGSTTAFLLNGVYASNSGVTLPTDPDGVSGGRVARISGQNISGLRYILPELSDDVGIPVRIWMDALPTIASARPTIAVFSNAANGEIVSIVVETTGRISAYRGSRNGTLIETTVSPVITANGWYHIETRIARSDVAGEIEVRVEGVPVLELDTLDLGTSEVAQVALMRVPSAANSATCYFKDFVIWDDSGSFNNTFLGSVLVHTLTPDADIDLNWTPSSGTTGYEILDNIPPVDATYLYAEDSPLPDPYVCSLSNLPDDVTSVKGLITFVRAAKNDGGDGSLQVSLISDPDGTPATFDGADRPITVAQTYWRDVSETDPKTSAAWTPPAVDDAHLKLNRTT